jgi:hypothetical protein
MLKRVILAIVAVYVAFTGLSMVMHGVILGKSYATPVFRPEPEMMVGLSLAVNLIVVWAFVLVYARFVQPKSVLAGLGVGALWGIAAGASMGLGSYSAEAIEFSMAATWCVGTFVQFAVAGLLTGLIVRPCACACECAE